MNDKHVRSLTAFGLVVATVALANSFILHSLTNRIERLEDRSARIVDLIAKHLEYNHGIKSALIHSGLTPQESSNLWFAYQFAKTNAFTNSISITISNASEKTITVTFPKPYEANNATLSIRDAILAKVKEIEL